jgi:uncharacterized metal-binding protein YceD (DUF177 family)
MSPEFSRLHRLGAGEARRVEIRANAAECTALAQRFAIPAVQRLEARLTLAPETGGTTRLTGSLEAEVVQECVVTLEPVAQPVHVLLDLRILPPGTPATDDDPDSPDEIETTGNSVDLGEVVAEQLALSLDPYPRAPDAAIPPELRADPEEGSDRPAAGTPAERPNPFAALARVKRH